MPLPARPWRPGPLAHLTVQTPAAIAPSTAPNTSVNYRADVLAQSTAMLVRGRPANRAQNRMICALLSTGQTRLPPAENRRSARLLSPVLPGARPFPDSSL